MLTSVSVCLSEREHPDGILLHILLSHHNKQPDKQGRLVLLKSLMTAPTNSKVVVIDANRASCKNLGVEINKLISIVYFFMTFVAVHCGETHCATDRFTISTPYQSKEHWGVALFTQMALKPLTRVHCPHEFFTVRMGVSLIQYYLYE